MTEGVYLRAVVAGRRRASGSQMALSGDPVTITTTAPLHSALGISAESCGQAQTSGSVMMVPLRQPRLPITAYWRSIQHVRARSGGAPTLAGTSAIVLGNGMVTYACSKAASLHHASYSGVEPNPNFVRPINGRGVPQAACVFLQGPERRITTKRRGLPQSPVASA